MPYRRGAEKNVFLYDNLRHMKILSWNVNGLRAALGHGAMDYLLQAKADVYLLQEIRTDSIVRAAEIGAYYCYWNFCKTKPGYGGLLCMTRDEPIAVSGSIGHTKYDGDARATTLEFREFYIVNCYCPTVYSGYRGKIDREDWDRDFYHYLRDIARLKPVIVCGDFNVPHGELDVYPPRRAMPLAEDVRASEKRCLDGLVESGFVDTFRSLYPTENQPSWWSPKSDGKAHNYGERIDYAFVSEGLREQVVDSRIKAHVPVSDHCPVELVMRLELVGTARLKGARGRYAAPEGLVSRAVIDSPFACLDLSGMWDNFDWEYAETFLGKKQKVLAKVAYTRNLTKIRKLQQDIIGSIYCRALAVRKVCSYESVTGIDKVRWTTSREKMEAALALRPEQYKALADRLIIMRTSGGKMRRIRVGAWFDRAMQVLARYALDPVAESWADRLSFAYRKGRSSADLCEYMRFVLGRSESPAYVWVGDVQQCYESINHRWIMEHVPMDRNVLRQFLEAGFVFGSQRYQPEEGVGIGSPLSPILANMTLDGLHERLQDEMALFYEDLRVVLLRFADDICVPVRSYEEGQVVSMIMKQALAERGLSLSEKKTAVYKVSEGFSFAGMHYRKENGYVYATPSRAAVERFSFKLTQTITDFKGTQTALIKKLNRQIGGWANHFRIGDSEAVFRELDVHIGSQLLQKCFALHPNWSREAVNRRYWYLLPDGRRCFSLPDDRTVRVHFLSDFVTYRHSRVNVFINPYIDTDYFAGRLAERESRTVSGRFRGVWERQDGRCYYCGERLFPDQDRTLVYVKHSPGGTAPAYVHTRCTDRSLEYVDVDVLPDSERELEAVLNALRENRPHETAKYAPLSAFFHNSRAMHIRKTFAELEEILGRPLPEPASRAPFWQRTGFGYISQTWLENGYALRSVKPAEGIVCWYRRSSKRSAVNIPEVFLSGNLPDKPKYELEMFFKYLVKKYSLEDWGRE